MADYPISNVPRRVQYVNSGVGPYAFAFEVLVQTDIAVYRGSTLLTLTADYTVAINSNGTGSVTLVTAGTGNITIVGARAVQRSSDYTTGGDLFASTLNTDLDSQTIFSQQLAEDVTRSVKAPVYDSVVLDMSLPNQASRANKLFGFTGGGQPAVSNTTISQLDAAVSSFVNATGNNASSIIYNPAGVGAVSTTVQTKLRETVSVMDFGAVGDGVTDDTIAIQNAIAATPVGAALIFPEEASFFIGDLVNDDIAFVVTKNISIFCNNSIFVCTASGTGTGASVFSFQDCKAYIDRIQINQTNFNFAGAQRGVVAVRIYALAASVSGHYVKSHVINGQSPLTVVTSDPLLYRSSDIEVYLTGVNSYYGINLASNGDHVIGYVYIKKYFRIFFAYDVDDVDMDIHGGDEPLDTSGQLNIFNKKVLPTSNIKLRAVFDALSGPIVIDDLTADAGTGKFVNIDLDIYVKTFIGALASSYQSSGVIRMGSFDSSGNWETSTTQTTEVELSCSFKSTYSMNYPAMIVYTPSSGRRTVKLRTENASIFNANLLTWYTLNNNQLTKRALNSNTINIPVQDLTGITINQIFIMDVVLSVREDTATFGQNTTTERWEVHGFSSGAGILNVQAYNRVYTSKTGAKTITVTMAATGTDCSFDISFSGYTVGASTSFMARVESVLI